MFCTHFPFIAKPEEHCWFPRNESKFGGKQCLKLTASLPLKIGLTAPKGNENVFQPSISRLENVGFREGKYQHKIIEKI